MMAYGHAMTVSMYVWLCRISLLSGMVCAAGLAVHVARHPQKMAIMNAVWPLCALFGGFVMVWMYWRYGRSGPGKAPEWVTVAKGTLHCGSGCTLGDLVAEWIVFAIPPVAVGFGWHWLFAEKIFATWIFDSMLAFGFGILFQYFAIAPMRGISGKAGIKAAIKADAASLAAWQIGMFAVMALFQFVLYPRFLGQRPDAASSAFWFAMQWAMIGGFVTSFPVNRLLIAKGLKEAM